MKELSDHLTTTPVRRLGEAHGDDVVSALCDAFADYPVMRYILGAAGEPYAPRLRTLIERLGLEDITLVVPARRPTRGGER